jgi:hypothetical protein
MVTYLTDDEDVVDSNIQTNLPQKKMSIESTIINHLRQRQESKRTSCQPPPPIVHQPSPPLPDNSDDEDEEEDDTYLGYHTCTNYICISFFISAIFVGSTLATTHIFTSGYEYLWSSL